MTRTPALFLALILLAILIDGRKLPGQPQSRLSDLGSPSAFFGSLARMLEAFAGPGHVYSHLAPAAGLGLSCAALFIIFHRFFSVSMVTRAMLAEAFVCYLILAIAFSQLYLLLSRFVDHPFNQQIPVTQSSTFLYFSMDTFSGVGTGVIAPINPYVRLITGIEIYDWNFLSGGRCVTPGVRPTARETGSSVTNLPSRADRMTARHAQLLTGLLWRLRLTWSDPILFGPRTAPSAYLLPAVAVLALCLSYERVVPAGKAFARAAIRFRSGAWRPCNSRRPSPWTEPPLRSQILIPRQNAHGIERRFRRLVFAGSATWSLPGPGLKRRAILPLIGNKAPICWTRNSICGLHPWGIPARRAIGSRGPRFALALGADICFSPGQFQPQFQLSAFNNKPPRLWSHASVSIPSFAGDPYFSDDSFSIYGQTGTLFDSLSAGAYPHGK